MREVCVAGVTDDLHVECVQLMDRMRGAIGALLREDGEKDVYSLEEYSAALDVMIRSLGAITGPVRSAHIIVLEDDVCCLSHAAAELRKLFRKCDLTTAQRVAYEDLVYYAKKVV